MNTTELYNHAMYDFFEATGAREHNDDVRHWRMKDKPQPKRIGKRAHMRCDSATHITPRASRIWRAIGINMLAREGRALAKYPR